MRIKGLLEMMFDKLSGWIDEFITDMEARLCRTCICQVLDAELWRNTRLGPRRRRARRASPAQPRRPARVLPRQRAAAPGRRRRMRPHMHAPTLQQAGSTPMLHRFLGADQHRRLAMPPRVYVFHDQPCQLFVKRATPMSSCIGPALICFSANLLRQAQKTYPVSRRAAQPEQPAWRDINHAEDPLIGPRGGSQ